MNGPWNDLSQRSIGNDVAPSDQIGNTLQSEVREGFWGVVSRPFMLPSKPHYSWFFNGFGNRPQAVRVNVLAAEFEEDVDFSAGNHSFQVVCRFFRN